MTSMVGEAVVEVRGDVARLKSDVASGGKAAGKEAGAGFTSGFKENLKGLAESLGVIYAGEKAIEFLKGSVEAAREANKVSAVTIARLKSTGDVSRTTAAGVTDLADALGRQDGIMPDVIQKGENYLLTFKNIRNEQGKNNDVFNQAVKTMVDLGVSMAGTGPFNPKTGAILLGKALNDPVKGLSALTRVGVQFTDQQKTQIAAEVAHGNALKAQKQILAELQTQFAGTAKAQANSADKMHVAWHLIEEDVGKLLIPIIDKFETLLTNKVLPKVSAFIHQMEDGKGAGGRFADTLHSVFDAAAGIAGRIGDVISALNGMPDWAKKALATGVIGGVVAKKLGVGSLLAPAAKGVVGGLVSKAEPVPVIIVKDLSGLGGGRGGIPIPGGGGGEPTTSAPKGPGVIAGGLSLTAEIVTLAALAKGSLDVTDSFLRWKSAGDNLTPTLKGIESQLQSSNVGKYASELHVNIPKLATDIQQFGDKGAYFNKVMDRLQGKPGLGSFLSGAAGTLIPGYTSGVEKADNATSDLLKITHAFLNVKGDAPVQTTKALETQLKALGFLTPQIKKRLDDLGKTKVKPVIGADSTPLEGRYRVSKSQLIELGHQHPTPIIDANNKPANMKVTAILHSLGIVDAKKVAATVDANTTSAQTKVQAVRNTLDALVNHPWSIFVGVSGPGAGGNRKGHAAGVMSSAAGPAIVGEQGRELVFLPGGSRVIPNPQTERMLGGGSGTPVVITNWQHGLGYIADLADERIKVQAGFDERMDANA